ncbi:MAG TPA: aldo/keto reductase [Planctomycetota bacterium]|jgi:voltage-dependent potassium channel beta subunit|nr:aldo/keto reductase [Planctomycetota bacterium]
MEYRRLGRSGIKVSALSFGSWLTFGDRLGEQEAKALMRQASDAGVNFFDNAEVYGDGRSEEIMGAALKDFRRESLVVSTKLFWGGKGPNDNGLSRKHILEGTNASLKRMRLDYVDLLYCHRADPDTPLSETILAMDQVVRSGKALYWGTSEWSAAEIDEAHRIAKELGCIPPTMEQPQYNLFVRRRFEIEYAPLFERYGMGATIWSPLASGMLTGKYNDQIPRGSRLAGQVWLMERWTDERKEKVSALAVVAALFGASCAQLAIAWCLRRPHVSSVILGATSKDQLAENLGALELAKRLDETSMTRITRIFGMEK